MNIGEAERYLNNQLSAIYDERESYNIADILIEHITGFNKSDRILKKTETLTEESGNKLQLAYARSEKT